MTVPAGVKTRHILIIRALSRYLYLSNHPDSRFALLRGLRGDIASIHAVHRAFLRLQIDLKR